MFLNKIDDPRDNLEKAHRMELVRFAHAHGLKTITEQMPAMLIRRELRSRGLTNIQIPPRVLGAQNQPNPTAPASDQKAVEINAADDLARQFREQQAQPPEPDEPAPRAARPPKYPKRLVERPKQEINVLRDECKRLGIKMDRRDNKAALKAKIEAHRG